MSSASRVPLVRVMLGRAEAEAVERVIRSGWVTQGPEVAAFEEEFAAYVGAPHAVAVSNCTVALELALRCVGIGPGDDVVTVSHSFIATANVITTLGARPVFADVEPGTYGMDPRSLARALTPRTRAVLPVHQIGIPCDIAGILEVARGRGVPVIEDAACAVGSEILVDGHWQRLGRPLGVMACFSFHPRKVLTTGDGGMITTADASIARRLRLLRQHAMSVPDTARHAASTVVFEEFLEPAWNFRLTDIQAAVGRPQLARLPAIIADRRRLADRYAAALAGSPAVAPPREPAWARTNWQSYPVTLLGRARDQRASLQFLLDRGIAAKRGVSNAHQEPAYADPARWAADPTGLAVSERLRDETMLIPMFHGMTDAEQDQVIDALRALGSS